MNKQKMKLAGFFAGVGGIELAFEQTGSFQAIYANEFDKYAQKTFQLNHPDTFLDKRDIRTIQAEEISSNEIDVIVGGFPCQAFSIAGYRKGFDDERGDLFFELLRFITEKKPKAIFIENVKNMVVHDSGNTFKVIREALVTNQYYIKWKVLNGKDYGNIPQNRERIYIVGFREKNAFDSFKFPEEIPLTKSLEEVIDFDEIKPEKYYYREGTNPFFEELKKTIVRKDTVYQWRRQYVRENKSGVVPTLTANMGTGGHNVPLILTSQGDIRKLTPQETFSVQGFPKGFKLPKDNSDAQLYKQAGNSVVVPVVERIACNIYTALSDSTESNLSDKGMKKAIVYTKMNGRFEGESYIKEFIDSYENGERIIASYEDGIPVYSDETYFKKLKKGSPLEFYSIISV